MEWITTSAEAPLASIALRCDNLFVWARGQFPPEERAAILSRFNIQYYEFTPVDFYKKDAFEAELRSLEKIEAQNFPEYRESG